MTSKKLTSVLAGLAAAALFTACTENGDPAPIDPIPTEQAQTTDPSPPTGDDTPTDQQTPPTGDDTPTDQQTPAEPDAAGVDIEAGFAAVTLAQSEAPGSQAVKLDWDEGQWQVEVLEGDTKHDFTINAEGTEVLERESESADNEDVERLAQAEVTLEDAVGTAMAEVDGTFDEADLDTHNDQPVWEVELDTTDGDVSVYVDVVSGEVADRS